jgi:uncharacterized protein (DUF2252 family)
MTDSNPMALPTEVRRSSALERAAFGKNTRKTHPRTTLGNWQPASERPDPVSILLEQEATRVPELLPIRHSRMAVNPFTFFRGTAAIMAYDLGTYPNSGLVSQLCGDAHLSNFGIFGSPDRAMIFDINDFDETFPGPFEWDVARMVTSFYIAARDNKFTELDAQTAALTAAAAYRAAMSQYATMNDLDQWYSRVDAAFLLDLAKTEGGARAEKNMSQTLNKARNRDRWSAINKLTEVVDGTRQFLNQPPLLARLPMAGDQWEVILALFEEYRNTLLNDRRELLRRYQVIDFAHKVVGVGSVGLRAFVVLLQGRDPDDVLVLQVKEAVQSALAPYASDAQAQDEGYRVVAGQRLMQAASDVFLGWITGSAGRHFYLRQLRDMKWSPEISALNSQSMRGYAQICGKSLARGHARSGDSIAIAAYLGTSDTFDQSLLRFAQRYSVQVNEDFEAFTRAIADGTLSTASSEDDALQQRFTLESHASAQVYRDREAQAPQATT